MRDFDDHLAEDAIVLALQMYSEKADRRRQNLNVRIFLSRPSVLRAVIPNDVEQGDRTTVCCSVYNIKWFGRAAEGVEEAPRDLESNVSRIADFEDATDTALPLTGEPPLPNVPVLCHRSIISRSTENLDLLATGSSCVACPR